METTRQQQHTAHYDHQARRAAQRAAQPALSGTTIVRLMRQNGKTIRSLAASMGITQVRVREVRADGVRGQYFVADWLEALTGRTSL